MLGGSLKGLWRSRFCKGIEPSRSNIVQTLIISVFEKDISTRPVKNFPSAVFTWAEIQS